MSNLYLVQIHGIAFESGPTAIERAVVGAITGILRKELKILEKEVFVTIDGREYHHGVMVIVQRLNGKRASPKDDERVRESLKAFLERHTKGKKPVFVYNALPTSVEFNSPHA